ncbi:MAG TPA: hypothetical protein DDZ41_05510 [Flavobacterium sp.]|nr:hypothetical protein [Flavobacterium sp.]
MNNFEDINKGKTTAIVSYLTLIGTVIAILMNNDTKSNFASFHIRQALGIFLTFFLLGYFIGYFDSWMITAAFWVFIFALWGHGFMNALNGEEKEMPIVGKFYQDIFKSL